MVRTFTVSQAARELGCSERWLRDAEGKGKIPEAKRDFNDWRVYTLRDIEQLKKLRAPSN